MLHNPFLQAIFYIFSTAFVGATIALFTRQSLLVVYMLLGLLIGPSCLGWIQQTQMLEQFADFGILSLLFLMGMHLEPKNLLKTLKDATTVTLLSSVIFIFLGFALASAFGFTFLESVIVGLSCSVSSTILSLKLLPTTALHHQPIGAVVIGIALLQDILAIFILLALQGMDDGGLNWRELIKIIFSLPVLAVGAFLIARYGLSWLLRKFDRIQEYVFLMAIAWCLIVAETAEVMSLSPTIGAFIAGVSLTATRVANYITESLKPLRDFFLILFFVALGAKMNLTTAAASLIPALVLAILMLGAKPAVLFFLLRKNRRGRPLALEVAARLGQLSEFSLLIAYLAGSVSLISERASYTIQLATLMSFIVSSYWVVLKYPTPVSSNPLLRRD